MTATESREFHLSDILSVTTGRLVSTRHIDGVYDILNFMTRDNLLTHQLIRAYDECKPALFEQHPQLAAIDASCVNGKNWKDWLNEQVKQFGEKLCVRRLSKGEHMHRDPVEEAQQMMGDKSKVLIVEVPAKSMLDN